MKNFRATTTYLTDKVRDEELYQKGVSFEEKDIKIKFILSPVIMNYFSKKAEEMGLKDFLITDKDIVVFNSKGVLHQTRMPIPMMYNEGVEALFSLSNLKHLLNLYYQVDIAQNGSRGLGRFRSLDKKIKITYFIATEQMSSANETM